MATNTSTTKSRPRHIIKTEGDLEAIILHENKNSFAAIINRDLYEVVGEPPHQNIYFHNSSCFDLFCIHAFELLAEQRIQLEESNSLRSLSLFTGVRWLTEEKYKDQHDVSGLIQAIDSLDSWLLQKKLVSFWCGDISQEIEFDLSRRQILHFVQLLSKHNLLRLSRVFETILEMCRKSGYEITEKDVLFLIEPFVAELKTNRVIYHSSFLIEMLYVYFTELNKLIYQVYGGPDTARKRRERHPKSISSDAFKEFFWSAVNFATNYNKSHYETLRPRTTKYLKMRY